MVSRLKDKNDPAMPLKLNVHNFPRPPLLEKISQHLRIVWDGHLIAETKEAYWALETTHPPTYYLPPSSLKVPLTPTQRHTTCEWKGQATYHTIHHPSDKAHEVANRIWSYEDPTPSFKDIRGYLSFYVGPWDCFVDVEKVQPQPGDFYGGWMTSNIDGGERGVKGGPGTWCW